MFTTQTPHPHATVRQLGELGLAAPQVMAHRMTRLWMAGPILSEHDREEFTDMVLEKQQAFVESWLAMFGEVARLQQNFFLSFFGNAPSLWSFNPLTLWLNVAAHHNEAANSVFSKGLAPVHSRAVENSQRLTGTASRERNV